MPGISVNKIPIPFKRAGINWSSYWTTSNLVIEGHSFVSTRALPILLGDILNLESLNNVAISGSTMTNVESRAATVDGYLTTETTTLKNILFLYIGVNDITAGATGAEAYASVKSYIDDRVAAGWKVFTFTMTPKTGLSETERDAFNVLLKAAANSSIIVIDTDTASELDDPEDTDYYSDGLHPTDLGNYKISRLFETVISTKYPKALGSATDGIEFTFSTVGTGDGIATLTIQSDVLNCFAVSGGDGNLYYDTACTMPVSSVYLLPDTDRNLYFKNAGDVSNIKIREANINYFKWTALANAPSVGGDISQFVGIGTIDAVVNSFSGAITGLTALTYVKIQGNSLVSGDVNPIVADLTLCTLYGALTEYTSGAVFPNIAVTLYAQTGYGYDVTELSNIIIDMDNSVSGPSGKAIAIRGASASLADTTQGGIWGDFDGETSPSALAIAYKSLAVTKGNTLGFNGITAPGGTGDGTGFPAGFGDWYRS